ncbi:MAG: tetratricopeptide repeat protein [Spirochaetota bacterium]
MPRKEDIDSIGAVLHLLGEKPLPDRISKEDYKSYKDIFTDDILSTIFSSKNVIPSIDELMSRDTGGTAGASAGALAGATAAPAAAAPADPLAGLGSEKAVPAATEPSLDDLLGGLDTTGISDTGTEAVPEADAPVTDTVDDVLASLGGAGDTAEEKPADVPPVEEAPAADAETSTDDALAALLGGAPAEETAPSEPDIAAPAAEAADETPIDIAPDVTIPDTTADTALDAVMAAAEDETPAAATDAVDMGALADIAAPLETTVEEQAPKRAPAADTFDLGAVSAPAPTPAREAGDELPSAMRIRMYPRIKLTDEAMAAIVERLNGLSPYLQSVALDAILYDKLEESDMQKLLDMLAVDSNEGDISSFFHSTLGVLAPSAVTGVPVGMPTEGMEGPRVRVPRFIPAITAFVENYLPSLRIIGFVVGGVVVVGIIVYALIIPWRTTMLIEEGLRLIDKVEYEKAEQNFKEATQMRYFFGKPFLKNIPWYDRYAARYLGKGATEHAKRKLDTGLGFDPKNMDLRLTYGVYYRRDGELHKSGASFMLGEILYKHILSGYNRRRIERAIASGDVAKSVKAEHEFISTETWATNVKSLEPVSKTKKVTAAYDGRGMLYIVWADTMSEPERLETAIDNYRTMLTRIGDGVLPRKRFAQIYIRLDDRKYVEKQIARIKAFDEEFIDDELSPELARYLLDRKEYVKSRVLMENILRKYPGNERTLIAAADYWIRLKEYDRAEMILSNYAMSLYGPTRTEGLNKRAFIHNMLGEVNYNRGQYVSAIEQFNEALKVNGTYADAHENLAKLYFYQNNNYEAAAYHYEMAARQTPDIQQRPNLLNFNLGWINYYRGDAAGYENAYQCWYPVHQHMRGNPVAAFAVGNALLHMKEKENLAEGYYLEAKELLERLRERTGKLSMDRAIEFHIVNFLASLHNNMGVVHYRRAVRGIDTDDNMDKAFRAFVQSAQYFDLVKSSRREMMEERVVVLGKLPEGDVGIPKLNIMRLTDVTKRGRKRDVIIDDYIPKELYYLGK